MLLFQVAATDRKASGLKALPQEQGPTSPPAPPARPPRPPMP
ncbi:hypothetical protein [Lysobacter enzymogenes]